MDFIEEYEEAEYDKEDNDPVYFEEEDNYEYTLFDIKRAMERYCEDNCLFLCEKLKYEDLEDFAFKFLKDFS